MSKVPYTKPHTLDGPPMVLTVSTFRMGTDKEAAVKVLEEASEAREAWQVLDRCERRELATCRLDMYPNNKQLDCQRYVDLADELADVIQAACNLAARYGLDMPDAMRRCEARNRDRGRYQ